VALCCTGEAAGAAHEGEGEGTSSRDTSEGRLGPLACGTGCRKIEKRPRFRATHEGDAERV
jgi:hypothetical protein